MLLIYVFLMDTFTKTNRLCLKESIGWMDRLIRGMIDL